MSQPTISTPIDRTDEILRMVKQFKNDAVLVGIPSTDSSRSNDTTINNAALLFINNFGSPVNNIPARPVMDIGIRKAQVAIAEEFKKAAQNAFKQGLSAIWQYYERAGMIASNSVKRVINTNDGIAAPADATIESRIANGFHGNKALIVTGQMRNAITYVVNKGGI